MKKTMNQRVKERKFNAMQQAIERRELVRIPLVKIKVVDFGFGHEAEIASLQKNVEEYTLTTPISVVGPGLDGYYTVIDGGRRIRAVERMGANPETTLIPCYVLEKEMSERKMKLLALAANMDNDASHRHAMRLEAANLLYEELANGRIERHEMAKEVAEACNIGRRHASDYVEIAGNGYERVIEETKAGKLPVSVAAAIARAKPNDEVAQETLVRAYNAGHPVLAEAKKEILNNADAIIESGRMAVNRVTSEAIAAIRHNMKVLTKQDNGSFTERDLKEAEKMIAEFSDVRRKIRAIQKQSA